MLWTEIGIQTLREDTHPPLVRAGYKRAGEKGDASWLPLGRLALEKIRSVIATGPDFGGALSRCGIAFVAARGRFVVDSPGGVETLVRGASSGELLENAVSTATPPEAPDPEDTLGPEPFHTPNVKTIAQIAEFTGLPVTSQIKSLVVMADEKPVLVLLRGDHTLNENKLRVFANVSRLRPASPEEIRATFGADPGSLGPVGAPSVTILADTALKGRRNLIAGANRNDYHLRNVTPGRDFQAEFADLRLAVPGDTSADDGSPLTFSRVAVLSPAEPGGILEAAAAQHHDADGLVLPPAVAPFHAVVTPVHPERLDAARRICGQLEVQGCEVLLDDRDSRPGVKFKDADLLGIPFRINVGKKWDSGIVELVDRSTRVMTEVPADSLRIPL